MASIIHQRVDAARAGTNSTVVCRVASGWVVLGDVQYLRGYAILLADPIVPSLNTLSGPERSRFLLDMGLVGDALLEVTGAARINCEILGNQDPALHAHVFPRYADEPEEYRSGPPFFYPPEQRNAVRFDPVRDRDLMVHLAAAINRLQQP